MRIVTCFPVDSHHLELIRAAAPPDTEIVAADQENIAELLFTADIFCGHAKVPVDWDGVIAAGRLQWLQSSAAGMDHCLVPSVIESDVPVTSASGVLADQVAEHTIALLTAWCRSLPLFFRAKQNKEFIRRPTRDLTRSTVGIVGFGGVGRRLAEVLRPFKTRILATDLFPQDRPEHVEALWPADQLEHLLAQADFVVLSLPLNEMTRGLFDGPMLDNMPAHAVLANMARGPLVVTEDLVDRLEDGRIAGAVMDVTDPEPLPEDSRLWNLPGTIITPHVGGQSRWRIDNMTRMFCENLRRWQTGEPLINFLTEKRLGFPIRGTGYPLWVDVVDRLQPPLTTSPEGLHGSPRPAVIP